MKRVVRQKILVDSLNSLLRANGRVVARETAELVFSRVPRRSYTVRYSLAPKFGEYQITKYPDTPTVLIQRVRDRLRIGVCFLPKSWRGRVNRKVVR